MEDKIHDVLIIGGGPAGYTAAIYAQRYKLDTVLIAAHPGGTAADAHSVENWPGTKAKSGLELMNDFREHAESYGMKTMMETVQKIEKKDDIFLVHTDAKKTYVSYNIILALGLKRRKLNIPGEEEFLGKGVSYCATCDAFFYKDKKAAVVGGSNAATMAALLLSEIAQKVYLIYRKSELRGEPVWAERVMKNDKIEVIYDTAVTMIKGENVVKSISLSNGKELEVNGIFIEVGSVPSTALVKALGVELDEHNYIIVDDRMETNIKGVYAAGDITTGSDGFKQIVTAASEGSLAAANAYKDKIKRDKK